MTDDGKNTVESAIPPLSIHIIKKYLSHEHLLDLKKEFDRHTYRYILLTPHDERKLFLNDLRNLKEVVAFSINALLEALYQDHKVLKCLAMSLPSCIVANENSLRQDVDNEEALANDIRSRYEKELLIHYIRKEIGLNIIVYDYEFNMIEVRHSNHEDAGELFAFDIIEFHACLSMYYIEECKRANEYYHDAESNQNVLAFTLH